MISLAVIVQDIIGSDAPFAHYTLEHTCRNAPSVNDMYVNGFKGRRVLSKAGREFKSTLVGEISSKTLAMYTPWQEIMDSVYKRHGFCVLQLELYTELYNKSWKPGGRTEKGGMQLPYKKLDGPNYIKALEDAVSTGVGIDDACSMHVSVTKRQGHPRIEIAFHVVDVWLRS